MQPAFLVDGGSGGFGVAIVAEHDEVTAGAEFPLLVIGKLLAGGRVDDFGFHSRHRAADRFDAELDGVVAAGLRDDGRCFGLAVGDGDLFGVEFVDHLPHDFDGAGCPAHDAGAER